MSSQNFVGTKPVDEFPAEAVQKLDDNTLTQHEVARDPKEEPGANKRAGVATRDPKEFDTKGRGPGSYGDPKPVNDPVI